MRALLIACVVWTCSASLAWAGVDGVSVSLAGGEVKGLVQGQGKATVRATVSNSSGRDIQSVVLAAFYSAVDEQPGDDAKWRVHAFEFTPPLATGKSATVKFTDDNALEYIKLDVQAAKFGLGLSYKGEVIKLTQPLMDKGGIHYIATRDLMDAIGGSISYDSKTYMLSLVRKGVTVQVKPALDYALVNGAKVPLQHQVLELDGRSQLPLEDIVALYGLSVSVDNDAGLVMLEE
jgi:hypothetical protein